MAPGSDLLGEQSDARRTPSPRDALAQAGLLGSRKPTAPLSGYHAAGKSEPSAHSRSSAGLGDDSTRGGQPGQRGRESSAQETSQNQVQHEQFSKALPFGSRRA